jgi:hypothetical protein
VGETRRGARGGARGGGLLLCCEHRQNEVSEVKQTTKHFAYLQGILSVLSFFVGLAWCVWRMWLVWTKIFSTLPCEPENRLTIIPPCAGLLSLSSSANLYQNIGRDSKPVESISPNFTFHHLPLFGSPPL